MHEMIKSMIGNKYDTVKLMWSEPDGSKGYIVDVYPTTTSYTLDASPVDVSLFDNTPYRSYRNSYNAQIDLRGTIAHWSQYEPKQHVAIPPLQEWVQKGNSKIDMDAIADHILSGKCDLSVANLATASQPEPVAGYWINPQMRKKKGRVQ